jgi:plasmid maintenance system killer protein
MIDDPIVQMQGEQTNLASGKDSRAASFPTDIQDEAMKGHRAGQMSIRINDQWRICLRWSKGDAHDVEIVDYHS